MIPAEKDNQIELFTYFENKAHCWFGIHFAGLCEECDEKTFENWCIKNKGFYSYEMFLLAKWVWNYYE